MNLRQIWFQNIEFKLNSYMEDIEPEHLGLIEDRSGYVYVDGEEGDYGVVRYTDEAGELVLSHVIEGGDSDYYVLTAHGKEKLMPIIMDMVRKKLENGLDEMIGEVQPDTEGYPSMRP